MLVYLFTLNNHAVFSLHFRYAALFITPSLFCLIISIFFMLASCYCTVYLTACSEHGHLIRIPSHCLLMFAHSHTFYCHNPRFFALLLLCGDIELNPDPVNFTICTLNIRSILHPVHSAALSDLIDSHQPDLFCLTETWIKPDTTPAELIYCTPPFYFLRNSSANRHHPTGSGTAFLIREPFTLLSSSTHQFYSFEVSSVTLKLPQAKIYVFNIYRTPSSSAYSVSDNTFLHDFNEFLSFAATTPHEFIITGDFNIHLDNPTDHLTSQFLSLLSFFLQSHSARQLSYAQQESYSRPCHFIV